MSRWIRANCSSSGVTCNNYTCKLKLLNRTTSLLTVGCKDGLKRTLRNFKLDTTTKYRSLISINFRTLININNINICPVLKAAWKFPQFSGYVDFFNLTYPNIIHPCPYRSVWSVNASLPNPKYHLDGIKGFHTPPNGIYVGN